MPLEPPSVLQIWYAGPEIRKIKIFLFVFEMSTLASKNAQGASATGQLHMAVTCALRWAGRLFRVAAQQPRRCSFRYRPHFHGRRWADAQPQNWKQHRCGLGRGVPFPVLTHVPRASPADLLVAPILRPLCSAVLHRRAALLRLHPNHRQADLCNFKITLPGTSSMKFLHKK